MKNAIRTLGIAVITAIIGFSMTACDDGSGGGTGRITAPTITTATLPYGEEGKAYSQTLLTAAGSTPITWLVSGDGTLPDGLTLSEEGVISGTPTTGGTSTFFTVKATNVTGKNTKQLSITISKPFDSIDDLETWLASQPDNTAAAPYFVNLNVSDLGGSSYDTPESAGYVLIDNSSKYVSLDLSGSTITSIGQDAFAFCTSLTGITLPNSGNIARNYSCGQV